jgi:hypothetical protein
MRFYDKGVCSDHRCRGYDGEVGGGMGSCLVYVGGGRDIFQPDSEPHLDS